MKCLLVAVLLAGCVTPIGTVTPRPGGIAVNAEGQNPPRRCSPECQAPDTCNLETLRCERVPCNGRCGEGERCDQSQAVERCVPAR